MHLKTAKYLTNKDLVIGLFVCSCFCNVSYADISIYISTSVHLDMRLHNHDIQISKSGRFRQSEATEYDIAPTFEYIGVLM